MVDIQVNEMIMLSVVTDPNTDYIFVTDFDILAEYVDNVVNQACRTVSTATTLTSSTTSTSITPSASTAMPMTVPYPGESMFKFLYNFLTCVVNKSRNIYFYFLVVFSMIYSVPISGTVENCLLQTDFLV